MAKQQAKSKIKILLTNLLGGAGYITATLQWLWVLLLYSQTILSLGIWQWLHDWRSEPVQRQPITMEIPTGLALGLGGFFTVITLAIVVIILVRLPISAAKTGRKVTVAAAESTLPVVTQHKKLPPAAKKRLVARLTWSIKLVLVSIPLLLTLLVFLIDSPLEYDVAVVIGGGLGLIGLVFFALQYALSRIFNLKFEDTY